MEPRTLTAATDSPGHSALSAVWLQIVLTIAMILPMLVLYAISTLGPFLIHDLNIRPGLLGYFMLGSFGLAAVLSLWAGPFVDRFGSRTSLIVLFSVVALAFTLIATIPAFPGLVAAAAVCGIAQALANPVTNLLIAQQVPPEKKAFVVGLKQSGVQVAALFAGLVLPSIATVFGWRTAFGVIVPLAIIFALAAPSVAPKSHAKKSRGFKLSPPNSLLLLLMGVQLCVGIGLSAFVTFLPIFAIQQGLSASLAGIMVAVFGAMGIISRLTLTPVGARLRDESLLLFALIAIAAIAILVTMHADPASNWKLWVGAAGVGLTAVATNAIAMGMLIRDPAFGTVATASGLISAAFFAGFALGPPAYGIISSSADGYTGGWSALIGVLLFGCMLALALAFVRRRRNG